MREGLQKVIKEILIADKKVIVPGFGTFISEPEPAFLERIKGGMMPPGEKVSFISDRSIQDSHLKNSILNKYQLPENEVDELIQSNVDLYWKALEENDVIQFPGIGNVYLDYQNKIQFIQEKSNVSGDYFGLPKIQIENQPTVAASTAVAVTDEEFRFQEGEIDYSNNIQKSTPKDYQTVALYAVAVLAFLVAGTLAIKYYVIDPMKEDNIMRSDIRKKTHSPITDSDFEHIDSLREEKAPPLNEGPDYELFNEKKSTPSKKLSTAEPPIKSSDKTPDKPVARNTQPEAKETSNSNTTTLADENAQPRKAVVIINAFENDAKASKFIKILNKNNYVTYSDTKGKLTRVGIEIQYQSEKDLNLQVASLKKEWNKDAWLLFK